MADIVDRAPTPVESLFDSASDLMNTIRRLRERWEGLRQEPQVAGVDGGVRGVGDESVAVFDGAPYIFNQSSELSNS